MGFTVDEIEACVIVMRELFEGILAQLTKLGEGFVEFGEKL